MPEVLPNSKLIAPLLSDAYINAHYSQPAYAEAQPIYVLLQNGWNFERELYERLGALGRGEPRIVSAALYIWTNMQGANVVRHSALVSLLFLCGFKCSSADWVEGD